MQRSTGNSSSGPDKLPDDDDSSAFALGDIKVSLSSRRSSESSGASSPDAPPTTSSKSASTAVVHRFHSPSISSLADDEKASVHQHQLFAHACVQLLDERDSQDFLRRKDVFQKMLNRGTSLVGEVGKDEGICGCPLLTLIKSGTLFKLHKSISSRLAPKLSSLKSLDKKEESNLPWRSKSDGPTRLRNIWRPKFVEERSPRVQEGI